MTRETETEINLGEGEHLIARRSADRIYVTNQRVLSGNESWKLEDIKWIHGSLNFSKREKFQFPQEKIAHDGKFALWVLICAVFISGFLSVIWFLMWSINSYFNIGPHLTYQLAIRVGDEKILVMEDVRRQEVKRLGLALSYAWRMRKRALSLAAQKVKR